MGMDRLIEPALRGRPVAWYAPAYKYSSPVWREVVSLLAPVTASVSQQEHHLGLITGGSIDVWTLDSPDAGRGRAYSRVIIDEAAMVPELARAWDESIRPQLADYQGDAWLLSTPKGTADYFHTLFLRGQDKLRTEWKSWQMPTSTNPYIPAMEIEAMRDSMPELAFAQEVLAQFVTWAGSVFRRIRDAVYAPGQPFAPAAMIGVDWGRTNDYTVFTCLSHDGEVIEIERFRGIEYAMQRARLQAFWERHGKRAWIMAEINSMGGPVVEQLQRDGLPVIGFLTTAPSKTQIIDSLALAFERGVIHIPDDPVLIGELQAFEGQPGPSGMMKYGAPQGQHDDTVMSLAFAWAGLVAPRQQSQYLDPNTGAYGSQPAVYQISPI